MSTCCVTSDSEAIPVRASRSTLVARLLGKVNLYRESVAQKRRNERAVKALSKLDDDLLRDIGLSRGDIRWASSLPSSVDATTELETIARR